MPPGKAGQIDVVAVGRYDGNILPLIIRNNTERDVVNVSVSAVARDAAGQLIAAGGDQGFSPNLVRSGEYTFGYVYFGGATLPPDATFEFEVTAKDVAAARFVGQVDLEVLEASFLGDRIVGVLRNASDELVKGPFKVIALCLDAQGSILGHFLEFADKERAEPNDTVPFQIDIYRGVDCTHFLVAGSGFSF
ncbi:MAG: hypothetical protein C4345_00065 [Chloroflexota bacterium]